MLIASSPRFLEGRGHVPPREEALLGPSDEARGRASWLRSRVCRSLDEPATEEVRGRGDASRRA